AVACPGSLDCALKRRARCPPGAHACGPCLQHFQEDQRGLCVPRMRQPQGMGEPAEYGQWLSPCLQVGGVLQRLALKEAEHSQLMAQPLLEDGPRLLEPVTLGFSERGQRPESGLPSPRGAPTPTPRTSLGSPVSSRPVHMVPLEPRGGRGVLLVVFCVSGAAALAVATLCWCRLQREIHLTRKADYAAAKAPSSPRTPRISVCGPLLAWEDTVTPPSSRHKEPPKELESISSDEENEDGDFTVYECPGLAPTGEMEVRNPLFDHASLPAPLPEPRSPPPLP
uniref:Neural proliferation, differentiation and control 1 n=1 Tax=Chinchilla lanigera TaxID=34839 RepID=A0A8C2YKX2_CHILA